MTEEITGEIRTTVSSVVNQWIIDYNCLFGKNVGDVLESPIFKTVDVCNTYKWQLKLYPNGLDECKNVFSIYLCLLSSRRKGLTVRLSYKIVNNEGKILRDIATENVFNDESNDLGYGFLSLLKILEQEKEGGGKLSIVCEMILGKNEEEANFGKHRQLNVDLEQLIDDKEFSDVQFTFGNKELHSHKSILSGRSPVFAAMFRNNMKEKHENKVEITDVRHEIFLEMLRYIYAEKVNGIEKIASELLAAADKYSLDGLKLMCKRSLIDKVNADNVLENLLLADRHNVQSLKVKCIEFIVTKAADIVDKPEFRQLPPNIICDVCSAALDDKKKS